jgi:hypothetical protein
MAKGAPRKRTLGAKRAVEALAVGRCSLRSGSLNSRLMRASGRLHVAHPIRVWPIGVRGRGPVSEQGVCREFDGSLTGYMLTGACRIAAILQLGMWCQFAVTLNV